MEEKKEELKTHEEEKPKEEEKKETEGENKNEVTQQETLESKLKDENNKLPTLNEEISGNN